MAVESTKPVTEPEPAESLVSFVSRLPRSSLALGLGLIAARLGSGTRRNAALPEELDGIPKAALKKIADVLDLYADQLPPDAVAVTPAPDEQPAAGTLNTPASPEHTEPAGYLADPDPSAAYVPEQRGPVTIISYGPVLHPPHPAWGFGPWPWEGDSAIGQPGAIPEQVTLTVVEQADATPGEAIGAPFSRRRTTAPPLDLSSVSLDGPTWPDHDSWSAVETFVQCGWKYLAGYGYGLRHAGPPAWYLIAGTAAHATLDAWERVRAREGAAPGPDDTARVWSEQFAAAVAKAASSDTDPYADPATWRAANGGKENRAWWEDRGPGYIAAYVKARTTGPEAAWDLATTPDGELAIELGGTVPVRLTRTGDVSYQIDRPVEFRIDQILAHRTDGRRRIRDHKFGRSAPSPGAAQLDFYRYGAGILLPELTPADAAVGLPGGGWEGDYWLGRAGMASDPKPLPFERSMGVVRRHIAALDQARRAHVFLPNPGNFCGACALKSICPAFSADGKSPIDIG